ncbi:protein OS-9-like isoform X1 [Asterias amurensis]|uniref:protein OS-9-like isoform X1 n=1 Tax=Asterias amurensis TaxID=7602 RepID=UPI003AB2A19E
MAKLTWDRCLLAFCCSFSLFCSNIFAFLDLEELRSVHYDIDISATPVLVGRPIEQQVVHLRSKFGQRYECQLPDMTDYEKEQEEEKLASDIGISELLKPMENAPCLIKTKDWWSYEYCHGRHIKQYHVEDGKIQGKVIYLGYYESEMDWNNKTHKDAKRHRLNRYHSHTYVNGSQCDVTKTPRETEVRFMCAEGQGDSIHRIDEPSSCAYVLNIHTSRTCHHPYLRPPPSLKPRPILCYPALEQDQYDKYLEIKQATTHSKHHLIEIGSSEAMKYKKEHLLPSDSTPAGLPSTDQDNLMDEEEVEIDGLEDAVAMGLDPTSLSDMVKSVLKLAKKNVNDINLEVKDNSENGQDSTERDSGEEDEDNNDDDEELLMNLLLSEEFGEDEMLEDDELEELMQRDTDELVKMFRERITRLTSDPTEVERLSKMVDSVERTLGEIEAVNELLGEEEVDDEEKEWTEEDGETLADLGDGRKKEDDNTPKNLMKDSEEKAAAKTHDNTKVASVPSLASSKDKIKVKVTKLSMDKSRNIKVDSGKEVEVYDSNKRPIEEAIAQQLENAGINNAGKVEFRIVTYTPNEWPEGEDGVTILTEEESSYFKNLVMGLLGGGAENTEQERQERLESNYQFTWDPQGASQLGTGVTTSTDGNGIEADGEESVP